MNRALHWLKEETALLIPVILYFAICFNLFHYAQSLMMAPESTQFTSYLGATIGALLAGKVVLIADSLPCINAFPNKPIVFNITWKFFIYSLVVLLVQIIDYTAKAAYYNKSFLIGYAHLKIDLSKPLFWGIQIFVLMIFLTFIVFSELMRIIGQGKMKKIFFGS